MRARGDVEGARAQRGLRVTVDECNELQCPGILEVYKTYEDSQVNESMAAIQGQMNVPAAAPSPAQVNAINATPPSLHPNPAW